jgi:hypothetical protein
MENRRLKMKEKLKIQTIDDLKAEVESVLAAVQVNYERDGYLMPVAFLYRLSDTGEVEEVRILGFPEMRISSAVAQLVIRKAVEKYGVDLVVEVSEATVHGLKDATKADVILFYVEGKNFKPMVMSVEVDEKNKKVLVETKRWADRILDGDLILGLYRGFWTDA